MRPPPPVNEWPRTVSYPHFHNLYKNNALFPRYKAKKVIPMNPLNVYSMLRSRKAQLGVIEFKFFIYGLILGVIGGIVLAMLSCKGVLPKLAFLCG